MKSNQEVGGFQKNQKSKSRPQRDRVELMQYKKKHTPRSKNPNRSDY